MTNSLRNRLVTVLTAVLAIGLAAGALVSCATSSGSTASRVTVTEGTAPPPEKPPAEAPTSKQGLEVVSDPDRAEVWVDGDYKGLTPFIVTDITQGWHRLIVRKDGYREVSTWIQYTSDYMLYQTSLAQITGFLRISVRPENSVVTVGGTEVAPGLQELPVGTYPVVVRAFGFADFSDTVTIAEKTVTPLTVTLAPAAFGVNDLFLRHARVNPDNPGVIGSLEAQFSVTGPGNGQIEIYDPTSTLVYHRMLPGFTTWDQSFVWDLRDDAGKALADGDYRFVVTAQGSDGQASQAETALTIDRTLKIAARAVWSGSSGLLYAPVAEVLPAEEFQASVLGAA
ncbi:MAG TPA: PEGA domain-containing protein, partial [Spirochaetia bacterium]|nr:PEGA domain-containing protein [Spirochaetia bacterium]